MGVYIRPKGAWLSQRLLKKESGRNILFYDHNRGQPHWENHKWQYTPWCFSRPTIFFHENPSRTYKTKSTKERKTCSFKITISVEWSHRRKRLNQINLWKINLLTIFQRGRQPLHFSHFKKIVTFTSASDGKLWIMIMYNLTWDMSRELGHWYKSMKRWRHIFVYFVGLSVRSIFIPV